MVGNRCKHNILMFCNLTTIVSCGFPDSQHSQVMQQEPVQAHRFVHQQNHNLLQQAAMLGPPLSEDVMNLDSSNPFSLTSGTTQSTLSSLGDFSDASNFAQMLQEILGDNEGKHIHMDKL